ncbi:IS110 family transposase [Aliarcobacter cibarius]|uniref:IS110 family transposase n=1 Tax=Aliarcobacter cibarius TaxID=255507 RepID=A0ABY2V4W7_9BACT|nr:IS110 family transposase [Aliarcobacter cibarius]TLS99533.1 IS110 family transposase [Aliarcobacter cibarius]TLS99969.1 IS110 family transposase [Aliarcobacter cibarius]
MCQYFLGIDISKDSFDFCFIDSNEKLLDKNHYLMSYENYMESLQKNPQKVANFFLHPSVKYAS